LLSLLFLPGILLLAVFSKKIKLSILEKVMFGSVFWNYIFVSSTFLVGISSQFILTYFIIFQIISVINLFITSILIAKNIRVLKPKINFNLKRVPYWIIFSALLTLCLLLISFHTIFVEWDALAIYVPSAKSILATQGFTSQSYRLLPFFDVSPAIPSIYAWMLNLSSLDSLYSVPIAYFVLTLTTIFLIFKKLFPQKGAILPVIIFSSIPAVLLTISSRALYLDMPFVFFLLSILYSAIVIVSSARDGDSPKFYYVMFFMGLTLLCLTRIEFGLFLFPTALAILFFTLNFKSWQVLSVAAIGVVYYVREIRNILINQQLWLDYLQRLTPVIIISVLAFLVLKVSSISNNYTKKTIDKKFFIVLVFLTVPLLIYLLHNIIFSGFIFPIIPITNSEILNSAAFFNQISPSSTVSWVELLRWDKFLTVWWLVSPYLIPIIISFSTIVRKLYNKKSLGSLFVGLLIMWSTLYCDPQPRRLYYFAPFIAILASYGLFEIRKYYTSTGFTLRLPIYIIGVTAYTLFKMGVSSVNELALFYAQLYQPIFDLEFLAVCAAIFFLIFAPYENLLVKVHLKISKLSSKLVIMIISCLIIVLLLCSFNPLISATFNVGDKSRSQDYDGWYYYPDVVCYYNKNIVDNGVTVGYYCNELMTFANRSVIDLYNVIYGAPLYSVVYGANETQILEKLDELNVKYFLIPQKNSPFYNLYEGLVNHTVFGSLFVNNPSFHAIQSFKYAILYKYDPNYQIQNLTYSEIVPWNYNPSGNLTLISNVNSAEISGMVADDGRFSLMFFSDNSALDIGQTLLINLNAPDNSAPYLILFSNMTNRSTDFCRIYPRILEPNNNVSKSVFDINSGLISGNFTTDHVEGILIGVQTDSGTIQTLKISGIYSINYQS
jgi:hypothetical protein